MRLLLTSWLLAGLMVCGVRASATEAGPQAATRVIACDDALFKNASRARLVAAFGAANVTDAKFPGAEGEGSFRATVLFAKKPADLVHLAWNDSEAKAPKSLSSVDVLGANWHGPGGIHVGSPLAEVERANGRPFTFYGVGWDYGGIVLDWRGGALGPIKPTHGGAGSITKGCALGITFAEGAGVPAAVAAKAEGETKFRSDDPVARAAKLVVGKMTIGY